MRKYLYQLLVIFGLLDLGVWLTLHIYILGLTLAASSGLVGTDVHSWLSEVNRKWFSISRGGASWLLLGVRRRVPPHSALSHFLKPQLYVKRRNWTHVCSLLFRSSVELFSVCWNFKKKICWGINEAGLSAWLTIIYNEMIV